MSKPANAVLHGLLQKGQLDHARIRDITLPAKRIKGYPFEDAEANREFHAALRLAEEAGAVRLEWRRHYENEELVRLRLLHAEKLAGFLKTDYLPDHLAAVFNELDLADSPQWLHDSLDHLRQQWAQGKKAFGLSIADAELLSDIIQAVKALNDGLPENEPLDYRQFGARYLNNSKRTREIEHALSALYQQRWDLSGWRASDVLSQLNLIPLAHPVLLRGPVSLSDGKQLLSAEISPYIGVPVTMLSKAVFLKQPGYLLTIENLSSFNEYTRQITDDGLIIYTAGFPDRSLQNFYRKVAQSDAPVFHWGDTDPHGFMILKVLQKQIAPKVVHPHLMNTAWGSAYSSGQLKSLEKL
ncbi:MAG: DUF2220 domain-containing protein, partial [Gammaproteobacteria bacterium]|nr:DUF2220 domain-containing protein [Gammaproteobacteria bacterium]